MHHRFKKEENTQQKPTKIQRFRAGKVPGWAHKAHENNNNQESTNMIYKGQTADNSAIIIDTSQGHVKNVQKNEQKAVQNNFKMKFDDPERQQEYDEIQKSILEIQQQDNQRNLDKQKRIIEAQNRESEQSEDDEIDYQKLKHFQNENDPQIVRNSDIDQENENSSESSSISESEEEPEPELILQRPVYIPKHTREALNGGMTIRERMQLEEDRANEVQLKTQKEVQEYTNLKLVQAIQQDQLKQNEKTEQSDDDENMPFVDDSDEDEKYLNDEVAKEEWNCRELIRIKRDREARNKLTNERQEIQRRRLLTEEDRNLEDEQLGTDANQKKQQVSYNFMQKYYHKGAFYQGDSEDEEQNIGKRDFNMPTGEDKHDKSYMPSILQKRQGQFGRKGNSKWTHLTNEDTTNFDPATRVGQSIAGKISKRGGGLKDDKMGRPTWKRARQ